MAIRRIVLGSMCMSASLLLSACGASENPSTDGGRVPARYEVTATVLETPGRGPMLCVGAVFTSNPPKCGDVSLKNWSWEDLDFESGSGPTRWGRYQLTGDLKDGSFIVSSARNAKRKSASKSDGSLLCASDADTCKADPGLTRRSVDRIYDSVTSFAGSVGIRVISAGIEAGPPRPVEIHVLTLDDGQRLALTERFGSGRLRVSVALTPLQTS
jgi:hypothetical protein